jgi:Holliday junction resolvasome RuvABC ATP-dependent DNA helicase subunit
MQRAKLTPEGYAARKTEYYKTKAKMTIIQRMASGLRAHIERQEAATAAKISDQEKDMIGRIIEKYQNYEGSGDAKKDKASGDLMLKKYEDGAKVAMQRHANAYRKQPSD